MMFVPSFIKIQNLVRKLLGDKNVDGHDTTNPYFLIRPKTSFINFVPFRN